MENRSVGSESQMSGQIPVLARKENARDAAPRSALRCRSLRRVAATPSVRRQTRRRTPPASDLQSLQADLNRLKDTVSKFMSPGRR